LRRVSIFKVTLDVLPDRRPWVEARRVGMGCVETGAAEGMPTDHAVTTIHYLSRKELGNAGEAVLSAIMPVFAVTPATGVCLTVALGLAVRD
jgi:hypothetical protein